MPVKRPRARPSQKTGAPDAPQPELGKQARVELRTTSEEKRLLVAAATEEHLDVTAFVLRSALPAARDVVERASTVQLSARDTARVLALLDQPPEPTARLRQAAAAWRANNAAARGETRHDPRPETAAGTARGTRAPRDRPDASDRPAGRRRSA